MALHFHRYDQFSVMKISDDFIKFYYSNLNANTSENIYPYLRHFTIISSQKNRHQNDDIVTYFNNLKQMNTQFTDIDYDTLHSGARRINILVTGTITYDSDCGRINNKFTEFIHLSTGKEGEAWIQMSMMKII